MSLSRRELLKLAAVTPVAGLAAPVVVPGETSTVPGKATAKVNKPSELRLGEWCKPCCSGIPCYRCVFSTCVYRRCSKGRVYRFCFLQRQPTRFANADHTPLQVRRAISFHLPDVDINRPFSDRDGRLSRRVGDETPFDMEQFLDGPWPYIYRFDIDPEAQGDIYACPKICGDAMHAVRDITRRQVGAYHEADLLPTV